MAENSENIEAKLCAYVEGDLDDQGRAEIERHLDAHPNHRRLLAELTATRDLLRFLPRENAPADLAETFNAHLERAELLDGPSVDPAAPKIHAANLLPRLLALAAIIVLGAGLGAVVYFGLPRGSSNANYARVNPRPGVGASDGEAAVATASPVATTRPEGERERMMKVAASESSAGAVGEARRAMKAGKGGWVPEAGDRVAGKTGVFGAATSGVHADPVYVFVCATDLSAATREVTEKLSASNIAWQPADASAQLGQQQQAFPNQAVSNTNTTLTFSDPARVELGNALKKKQYLQSQVPTGQYARQVNAAAVTQPAAGHEAKIAVAGATSNDKRQNAKETAEQVAVANAPPATPAAPAAPATAAPRADEAVADQVQQQQALQPQQSEQPQQQQIQPTEQAVAQVQADVPGVNTGEVIGYRAKMTRNQVLNLSQSLNRPAQQVELIADDQELQTANAFLQNQQQQQQQFAHQARDEASADRAALPEAKNAYALTTPAPVTQPTGQAQHPQIAQADAAVSADANKVAANGGAGATADAAKDNDSPARGARQRGGVVTKVGPKEFESQAKAEPQQPAAAAAPAPAASPAPVQTPAAAQPTAPAPSAPSAVAASQAPASQAPAKQSPIASRAGGERQAQLLQKVAPHSRLRVTVDELAGPDMSPTCEVQLADDGTIGLPKLAQRIRVEGLSRAQAEQAIHDAYKSANVVDEPTVTIEPLPPVAPLAVAQRLPGDLAGNGSGQRFAAQTTQPAVRSLTDAVTATQPSLTELDGQQRQQAAAPTSGPAGLVEEPLDVVILVQRTPGGASTEPTLEVTPPANAAAAEPSFPATTETAKPAGPADQAAPNAAAPSVPQVPAVPASNAPVPTPPPAPPEVPAK